jgi:hypothetical protein
MGRFGGRHCAGRHRDVCPDNLGLHIGVSGEERGPKGPQSERTAERLKRLLSPSFNPNSLCPSYEGHGRPWPLRVDQVLTYVAGLG